MTTEAQVQPLPSSLKAALFYNLIGFWSFEYPLLYVSLLISLHIYIKYLFTYYTKLETTKMSMDRGVNKYIMLYSWNTTPYNNKKRINYT